MQRAQRGEQSVENALGRFAAIGQQYRRVGHQMPDIAHEHQAAASKGEAAIIAVRLKRAGHCPPAFVEGRNQITTHQAKPVGICRNLVLRVDGSDRVFQIDNRG